MSDHCALVVKNRMIDWGPRPFKTFDVWLKDRGFKELVKKAWDVSVHSGNSLERVKNKLKGLKKELKQWRDDVFNSEKVKKQQSIEEIEAIDHCDDDGSLQEDLRVRRIQLLSDLRVMSERENAMIKQKSRVEWIEKGDMNSKFFHSKLRWRRLNNEIKGLQTNGVWCEEPDRVKSEVRKFFDTRFEAQPKLGVNLDGVSFSTISTVDNDMLCSMFSEPKILAAISQCGSTKSLGPDGFNFNFIKNNWDIIGANMISVIYSFYESGYIPKGCNASFITLVPKRDNLSTLNEYRPISLVGCVYKVISKLLVNRLKRVLPNVIDKNQTAFLSGKSLLDSVLVANETVDFLKKEKQKGVIVKVDYEKAYDSVDSDFLVYMLRRLGFKDKWIKWIKACLTSATISVLVNGSPTKEFRLKRRLRQDDPLAPFLFLIATEGLAGLVKEASRIGVLEGVRVGYNCVDVKLLQFADDTLFFC